MAATNATHTYAHDVAAVSPHAHIHIPILTYTLSRVLRFRLFTTTDVDRRRTAGCCFSRFVCSVRSPRRTSVAGVRRLLLPHHLRGNACPPRCVCRHVSVLERRPAFLGAGAEVGPRTLCCACAPPLDRVRWCTLSPRMLECACASLFDRVPGSTLVYARPAHNLLRVRFSSRPCAFRGTLVYAWPLPHTLLRVHLSSRRTVCLSGHAGIRSARACLTACLTARALLISIVCLGARWYTPRSRTLRCPCASVLGRVPWGTQPFYSVSSACRLRVPRH